ISTVGCEAAAKLPPAETETTETERKDEHRPPVARESLSTASPQSPVAAESDGCCTAARSRRDPGPDAPPLRAADQPVLPQGPARELRQARADADARADVDRRRDARALGRALLGREPAAGSAAARSVPRGRRHHRAPDVRRARLRVGALVPALGREGRARRPARADRAGRG